MVNWLLYDLAATRLACDGRTKIVMHTSMFALYLLLQDLGIKIEVNLFENLATHIIMYVSAVYLLTNLSSRNNNQSIVESL